MERKQLGKTGISVSRMCFGTLTIGPLQANLPTEEGGRLIADAIENGVDFFDTAQLYQTYAHIRRGIEISGKADIILSSKTYAYTREMAERAVQECLEQTGRSYIDIFMLHEQESIHTLRGHINALEYLLKCKKQGVIRAVGASMHHIAAVYGAIDLGLDVIHPILNIKGLGIADGNRDEMVKALFKAKEAGIGIFSMKPLGGGNLYKKADACLSYLLNLACVDAIAIGCQSLNELNANTAFFSTGRFPLDYKEQLSKFPRQLHIDSWCEGCGRCVKACRQNALSIKNERAVCNKERCILCGYCGGYCPVFAIKVV